MSPSWMPMDSSLSNRPGLPQLAVEPVAALKVAEVDVGHQVLEPGGLHHPGVVIFLNGDLAGGVHLGGALHIGGLIHRHRGKLGQLLGGLFDQLPGA